MKIIFLLLGVFLMLAVNANGRVAFYPIEERGGREGRSGCVISSRSIEVDDDTTHGKQSSINPGSTFIPNSMDDDSGESEDDYDDEDDEYSDDVDEGYDDSGPAEGYPSMPIQYGGGDGTSPETSVSASSDMDYPSFYSGDKEKYKYKRKKDGGKKGKKGGSINCIIITKGSHHKHQHDEGSEKPSKLFGIFPFGRNRRSIARGLRTLKN